MLRRISFGIVCVFGMFLLAGCGKEDKPNVVVNVNQQNGDPNPAANPNPVDPQQKYDIAIANAFALLAEKKEDAALAAFQEAQTAIDNDYVKSEIGRLKASQARLAAAERIILDIQSIIDGGKAPEAAKLAADALLQFGDSDAAERLMTLKRQADALLAVQVQDPAGQQKFLADADAARAAKNYRAALSSYDQAVACGVDVTSCKPDYDDLRNRLTQYDELHNRAAELRKDAAKLEEAVAALEEARKAWDTPQIAQEIDDLRAALTHRRPRLAVADFEVIGDVGIPLVGRTIAEELLPHFKGRYDLVERSQVATIIEDLKISTAELHANETGRTELAKLAKARYFVVGSVSHLSGLAVNARLVDAQTGLVVQTAKIVANSPEELSAKLPKLAKILQMTDEEKLAHEQELAKAATIAVAEIPAALPAPPAQAAPDASVQPIVVNTPCPPQVGQVAVTDFVVPAPAAQPQAVVIVESPWRNRAFFVAVELGDNLMRRGLFVDAMRHFEFALGIAPDSADVRLRMDMCRPFLPQVIVVQASRPRLAVLPFVEIGQPGFVPYGLGAWSADRVAPYFYPTYDIVDSGQVYWWMGRLGLTVRDVLVDPSARLLLARAMGVRYFLMGNICPSDAFDVTAQIVDAEFNALVGSATIRAGSTYQLAHRLPELAGLILMPPAQQVVYVQQTVVVQQRMATAQLEFRRGNFKFAIGYYQEVLVARPNCVEARVALIECQQRQQIIVIEQSRQVVYQQQTEIIIVQQQQQAQLVVVAQQQAATSVVIDIELFGRRRQQASSQLVVQAQSARQSGNFALSISLYQSAGAMNPSPNIPAQLAMARAQGAAAERQRMMQAQAAQNAAMQAQYQQQLQASQTAMAVAYNRRVQADQARLAVDNARSNAAYNQLISQAQQAKARRQFDVEVSSLQTARTLQPSPQVEQMYQAALADQARAQADKKGPAARAQLDAQLAAAQARQQQVAALSARNQDEHDRAINAAQIAMKNKNYAEGKREFEIAQKMKQTKEAADGIRWANDEIAKEHAAAQASQKKEQDKQKQSAEFARLLAEGRQAVAAKQYDPAVQKLQAAVRIDPTNVEAQGELVKAQQARQDQQLLAHKQQAAAQRAQAPSGAPKSEGLAQAITQARAAIQAKQFDEAQKAIAAAGRIDPSSPELPKVRQELADARKASYTAAKDKHDVTTDNKLLAKHLNAAHQAIAAKQWEAADQAVIEAARLSPNDPALPALRQQIAEGRKAGATYAAAKEKHDAQIDQNLLAKHLNAAHQAIAAKQWEAADAAVIEAARLSPNDPALSALRQQIAEGRKTAVATTGAAQGQAAYEQAMRDGQTEYKNKQYAAAVAHFNDALKHKPNDDLAEKWLQAAQKGVAAAEPKTSPTGTNATQTQAAYEQAMRNGQAQYNSKNFAGAVAQFNEALKHKPNDQLAGQWLQAAQKGVAAAEPKPSATGTNATQAQAAYEQAMRDGQTEYKNKQYAAAVAHFNDALKHKPNDDLAERWLQAAQKGVAAAEPKTSTPGTNATQVQAAYEQAMRDGQAQYNSKNFYGAAAQFNEALKHKPNDQLAGQWLQAAQKSAAAAEPKVTQVQAAKDPPKVDPTADALGKARAHYDAYMAHARSAYAGKQFQNAFQYASEALKLVPNDPEATKIVNDSRLALTPPKVDPPKVEAPKVDPNQVAYNQNIQAARNAFAQRNFAGAIQFATEALKHRPNDPEASKIVSDSRLALAPKKK